MASIAALEVDVEYEEEAYRESGHVRVARADHSEDAKRLPIRGQDELLGRLRPALHVRVRASTLDGVVVLVLPQFYSPPWCICRCSTLYSHGYNRRIF